jgi:hypothetical protein
VRNVFESMFLYFKQTLRCVRECSQAFASIRKAFTSVRKAFASVRKAFASVRQAFAKRSPSVRQCSPVFASVRQSGFSTAFASINLQILKYRNTCERFRTLANTRERLQTLANTCERSVRRSFCAVTNDQNSR